MLRATVGLLAVGLIFYHSPLRRPFAAQEAAAAMTEAAQIGLRGAIADGHLDGALAGAAVGRIFLENARAPQRIISLSDTGQAGPPKR